MKSPSIEDLEDQLMEAMIKAQALGYDIAREVTIDNDPEYSPKPLCCALGAYAVTHDHEFTRVDLDISEIGKVLGLSAEQSNALACGFDGYAEGSRYEKQREYLKLGERIASRIFGEDD